MTTYQQKAEQYRDTDLRARAEMCIREQGYVFAADGRADIAALGRAVVAGQWTDIDAVIAAVVTAPGAPDLAADDGLLSQVQAVWPSVAGARHPVGG
jgi:hypothetical protein